MRILVCLVGLLILTISLGAAVSPGRVVLAEDHTATWCSYCPMAAEALEELSTQFPGRVIIVAYHSDRLGDPFGFAEEIARGESRGVDALPAVFIDGKQVELGDGTAELSVLLYEPIESRVTAQPVLELSLGYNLRKAQVTVRNRQKSAMDVNVYVTAVTPLAQHGKKSYAHVSRALAHLDGVKIAGKKGSEASVELDLILQPEWWGEGLDIVAWAEDAKSGEVLATTTIGINQQQLKEGCCVGGGGT